MTRQSLAQLIRCAGLNLCERQSGTCEAARRSTAAVESEMRFELDGVSTDPSRVFVWRLLLEEKRTRQNAWPEGTGLCNAQEPQDVFLVGTTATPISIRGDCSKWPVNMRGSLAASSPRLT